MGLVAALLLFLLLPVVGASCDPDDGGPVHLCYTGAQLVSGEPSVDMSMITAGSPEQNAQLRRAIVNTVQPPAAVLILSVLLGILLPVGAVAAAPLKSSRQAALAALTASSGIVMLLAAEVVAVLGMSRGVENVTSLFAASHSMRGPATVASEVVGAGPGFWLSLLVLTAVGGWGAALWARCRSAAWEREFRAAANQAPLPTAQTHD
ncbi:MAG: hypothetical protein ACRDT8_04225 [Micromonosporaceae bacterium]